MNQKYLIPLSLLFTQLGLSGNIFDNFIDGKINDQLWDVVEDGGTVVESGGIASFVLYEFQSFQFSGASLLQLQEELPSNSDFKISADFIYQHEIVDEINYGIVIIHSDAASFIVDRENHMGAIAHGSASDEYFQGPIVDSSIKTFELNYHASSGLFAFSVYSGGIKIGSITHSISGDEGSDLSSDWNLSSESTFEVWILAEKYSDPLPQSQVSIDSFELVTIPEPKDFALTIAILVLATIPIRKFRERHGNPLLTDTDS